MERHHADDEVRRVAKFPGVDARRGLVAVDGTCRVHYAYCPDVPERAGLRARLGLRPGDPHEAVLPGRLFYSAGFIRSRGGAYLAVDPLRGNAGRRAYRFVELLADENGPASAGP